MSLFTALKGFGAWFVKEFTKLYAATPAIEKVADAVLSYAAPALEIILSALDPAAAALVAPIFAEVQKDLHVVSGLIYDFGATPNSTSILSAVTSNLQSILDAGHIKDTALQGKVALVIQTISSLISALTASLKSAPATA